MLVFRQRPKGVTRAVLAAALGPLDLVFIQGTTEQTSDGTKIGQYKRRTVQRSVSTNVGWYKDRSVQTSDGTKIGRYKRRTIQRLVSTNVGRYKDRSVQTFDLLTLD